MQFSSTLRTNRAEAIRTLLNSTPTLTVYNLASGVLPGVANAATGTLLVTLPVSWGSVASGGQVTFTATSTNASFAGGPFTPTYCRLLASTTAHIEGTAGLAPTANIVVGAVTVSSGAVTAVAITTQGTGYPASTTYQLNIINQSGADGSGAIVTITTDVSGNTGTTATVRAGGINYLTGATATAPQPFDFMFNAQVANGGLISLSSGVIVEGNA